MIGAIKAYADAGNNVVVDYIQYDTSWTPKLRQAFKNHKVYWVKVNIPLEVLEEQEKDRYITSWAMQEPTTIPYTKA